MIILQAEHDYTLLFKAKAVAKTAKNPQSFTMIFDPGAGTTALDKQVAKNFGYTIRAGIDGDVSTVTGDIKPEYTVIPNLILNDVGLGPVFAHVFEFPKGLALRTSALLGMNVLSWFKISIDCQWDKERQRMAPSLSFKAFFSELIVLDIMDAGVPASEAM